MIITAHTHQYSILPPLVHSTFVQHLTLKHSKKQNVTASDGCGAASQAIRPPPRGRGVYIFTPASRVQRSSQHLSGRHNAKNGNMPGRNLGEIYSNVVLFDGADPVRILLIQKNPAVVMSNVWQLPGG